MNVWDIIIICAVIALVIFAIFLYRGRKRKGGCCDGSSSCSQCASRSKCSDSGKKNGCSAK